MLADGADACVIAYGPVLLPQAILASQILREKHGLSLKVINLPWLNQVDSKWLATLAADCPWIFTLDNHYLAGGQGEMIGRCLAELHLQPTPKFKRFGVRELPACGQNDEVLRHHRLDGESLAEAIREAMQADGQPAANLEH
jgi:transketolase